MLLYVCSVVLLAVSLATVFINERMADTERMLITFVGVGLFALGAYGMWVWLRRKQQQAVIARAG